jgi:hypothetical protein
MQTTQLVQMIEQATSNELSRPDTQLNIKVCKEIFSKPDK